MSRTVSGIFEKYGSTITVTADSLSEPVILKGFIQPMRYKHAMYLDGTHTPIGYTDGGLYLYIGEPSFRLDAVLQPLLTTDGRSFLVKRAEPFYMSGKVVYIWGILQLQEVE